MHTARVLGNVAADAAGNLRRGVRRVVESKGGRSLTDGEITNAGLYRRRSGDRVDLGNPVELGHPQQNAFGMGHGPTRKSRSSATCDDGYREVAADLQDLNYVLFGLGQGDHHGQLAVHG